MRRFSWFVLCMIFLAGGADAAPIRAQLGAFLNEVEIGLGAAGVYYPHYPGADQSETSALPIPYLEYRGENLRIDDDGLAYKALGAGRFSLDFSVSGALPVKSDDNRARIGMPDLDLMVEFGPKAQIELMRRGPYSMRLDIPARLAINVEGDIGRDRGYVLEPRLHLGWTEGAWSAELDTGLLYGSERYNDTFYQVAQPFQLPERPAFDAQSGQLAYRSSLTVKYSTDNTRIIGYVRRLWLSDAENMASPLMRDKDYVMGGLAVIRMLDLW